MPPRVALINVGFEPNEKDVLRSPPFGIMYIGAYLRGNGYDVALFDWSGESLGGGKKAALQEFRPDVVGFTVIISSSIPRALEVSGWAKEIGAAVVWGGPGPTVLPEVTLRDAPADAIVLGEGEQTMLELCAALHEKKPLSSVKGIAFLQGGRCVVTGPRQRIKDLDSLPMPLWGEVGDIDRYAVTFHGRRAVPVNTSRGCPNTCTFCYTKKMWGYKWIARSAESVIEEIALIKELYPQLGGVLFDDDLFAGDKRRVEELCNMLIESGADLLWCCELRADEIERDLLMLMGEAGCRQVLVGVESGSQRLLDMTMKGLKLEDVKAAFGALHEAGMEGVALLMAGLPGEREEDFVQTKHFLEHLGADYHEFKVYMPYPGTELYDVAKEHGFREPKTLEEWARHGEVHRSAISERNLSEVPWKRIERLMTTMAKRAKRATYWKEFKKAPLTAPIRGAKMISKKRMHKR